MSYVTLQIRPMRTIFRMRLVVRIEKQNNFVFSRACRTIKYKTIQNLYFNYYLNI